MKKLLLALLLPAFVLTVQAADYNLPKANPIATISFPKEWKVEYEDESLGAESPDEEIYINLEVNDSSSIDGAIQETIGYLKKEKVEIDKSTEKKVEAKFNGMDIVDFSWDGKDKDGSCKVSLTLLGITSDKLILMLYWASPEGEKKHEAALLAIQQSIKPLKK